MKLKTLLCYLLGPIGSGIFGFALVPFLAWYFSAEEIGKFAMFQVYSGLFVLIFTMGLDHSYVRFFHESNDRVSLFLRSILTSVIISFSLLSILNIFNPMLLSNLVIGDSNVLNSILISFAFVLCLILRFVPLVLRMHSDALKYSVLELFQKAIFFAFVFLLINVFFLEKKFISLLYSFNLSAVICILIGWYFVKNYLATTKFSQVNFENLKSDLKYGIPLALTGLASWILIYSDRFLLESLESFESLGIYSVAVSISGVVSVITSVFGIVWAPAVYRWVSTGKADIILPNLCELISYSCILIISLVGLLSFFVKFILPTQYEPISYFITLNVSVHIFFLLAESFGIGINIVKKTYLITIATVVSCLFNLLLCWFLIPLFGMKGAAISSSFSAMLFFLLRSELSVAFWNKSINRKLYIYPLLLFILMVFHSIYGPYYTVELCVFYIISIILMSFFIAKLLLNDQFLINLKVANS